MTKKTMTVENFIGALRKNMYMDFDAYSNYLFMQCLDKTLSEFGIQRVDVGDGDPLASKTYKYDLHLMPSVDNLLAFEKPGIRLPPYPAYPAAEMFIPMTGSAADLAHTQAAPGSVSGVEGDDTIELHTSAPRVELERDNERKKRCEGCESLTYSLLVPGCKTLIPVCRKMSCKLCVDIRDEDCPLVKASGDKLDTVLAELKEKGIRP